MKELYKLQVQNILADNQLIMNRLSYMLEDPNEYNDAVRKLQTGVNALVWIGRNELNLFPESSWFPKK